MGAFLVLILQLALTVLIEGTVMVVWRRSSDALGYSVLVNILTNPVMNVILMFLLGAGVGQAGIYGIRTALEASVVIIEAACYKGMMDTDMRGALKISLVLNLSSFVFGELIGFAGYWDLLDMIMGI